MTQENKEWSDLKTAVFITLFTSGFVGAAIGLSWLAVNLFP